MKRAILPWDQWLDQIRQAPGSGDAQARFTRFARELAHRPLLQRVYRLEDIGKVGRSSLDGRYRNGPPEVWETFALAMADCNLADTLLAELPVIAAATRLTDDPELGERCLTQLRETATWSPLQRPGWSLFGENSQPFTDPKGDGNWLATGSGVIAIIQTLQMLGRSRVPDALWNQLESLLEKEIAGCVDDWNARRPWFYKWENVLTNQWVVPTAGFLLASAFLGRERHSESYELGVAHLLMTLNACGSDGAHVEGLTYGSFTVTFLLHAAVGLAAEGDDRLLAHPFLQSFPTWLVHHQQPGGYSINAFDQGGSPQVAILDGKRQENISLLLALCALTGQVDGRWAVGRGHSGAPSYGWVMAEFGELLGQGAEPPPAGYQPPLWAQYDQARRINWRSSWDEETASGVWVRGCHPEDQHAHADHGHVNFIHRGRAILIEAGACRYHSPVAISHFASAFGHNVLTLGSLTPDPTHEATLRTFPPGLPKNRGTVPITVHRLDDQGGDVTVDPTLSYQGLLHQWTRRVKWNAEKLEVTDNVSLIAADYVNFRWHLGTRGTPEVRGTGTHWQIRWSDADLEITSSVPITLTLERMSDNTLGGAQADAEARYPLHACAVGRTESPVTEAELTLRAIGR